MNCKETRTLLDSYGDGELDLLKNLEVEEHLQDCPDCGRVYQSQQTLQTALSSGELYFQAPAHLRQRIQASLRQTEKAKAAPRLIPWPRLGLAAALALVAIVVIWSVARSWPVPAGDDALVQEVASAHVRSLMLEHLTDVASSNQHTVKPWFNGKLDFSPVVEDLANQGFPLIGGRLDYLNNRPVAALIYKRQQHVINVFIWPSTPDEETKMATRQGFHLFYWTTSGMTYWVVSDLNISELQEFVQLVQHHASLTTSPN